MKLETQELFILALGYGFVTAVFLIGYVVVGVIKFVKWLKGKWKGRK